MEIKFKQNVNQSLIDVASKLRQLIEQIFEIRMSEQLEFSVQQIVWASVEQYPPWPAKIVRKVSHHDKTVYKVILFADPTYCYLHSHSLLPFNSSQVIDSKEVEQNINLKRAIELAKFSISKQNERNFIDENLLYAKTAQFSCSPIAFEQTRVNSEDNIILPQKIQQHQNCNFLRSNADGLSLDIIQPSNVLQILDSYHNGKMTQLIGNLKRKQIMCFQNQLKQNLLLKYKLSAVDFLKQTPKNLNSTNRIQELRTAKKLKKKQLPKFQEKQMCLRKIQKILFQKGMDRHVSTETSLKIVNQIEKKSESMRQSCPSYFKENIIRTLQQISSIMQQIEQVEVEYIQKSILSFLEIEFHLNKFEEGSRMTQMNEEFGI